MKIKLVSVAFLAALAFAPTLSMAQSCTTPSAAACLINKLPAGDIRDAINEVNNEDHRLVGGEVKGDTLILRTQDMVPGRDGEISPREVKINVGSLRGQDGDDGASAYEVAVQNGFEGTEEDWLASLEGEQGVAGRDGKDGVDGVDGKDGRDGVDGKDADTAAIEAQAAAAQDEMNQRLRDMEKRAMQNDAALAGLGGLELRQGGEGVTSWSLGLGGISNGGYTEGSIAAGIHYGISDNMGVYGKISKSFDGDAVAGFIGIEGQF